MKTKLFECCGSKYAGAFWFRICGYGLHFVTTDNPPLFSERNGFKKFYYFGKWKVGFLKPMKVK